MAKWDYDGPILEIDNLSISFFTQAAGEIPAVMDFSCSVAKGEAMGLVGESGCGKSTDGEPESGDAHQQTTHRSADDSRRRQ